MVDVAIIGGGICGCSLLFELSHYQASTLLLERENDVGVGTTKSNSAIIHAGYDPPPGTRMARNNVEGNKLIKQLCEDLDILYHETGSLVIGFDQEGREEIERLYARGVENGVQELKIVEHDELMEMEPALSEKVQCALYAPYAGVINPWELAFAQAEVAVKNGAEVKLSSEVLSIEKKDGYFLLHTTSGDYEARFVVNAAGLMASKVCSMVEEPDYEIHAVRGQYYILDTTSGHLAKQVIFQCPTSKGKGVLVSPTVHGNLLVGPDSEDVAMGDLATTAPALKYIRETSLLSVPRVNFREAIRNFSGLRAHTKEFNDFIVRQSEKTPGFFEMAGIKSPGLTSAPSIAKDMVEMLGEAGLPLEKKEDYDGERRVLRFVELSDEEKTEAIQKNPLYGKIVCRCKTVTEGEIVDALHRPLPPQSLDAVKRRCNPGMGRCQGGFCGPRVEAIIARELHVPQEEVPLDRVGMDIIIGETKDESVERGQ